MLSMPVPALLDRLLFLVGQLGLDESAVARTVTAFPGILCYSVDKHLQVRGGLEGLTCRPLVTIMYAILAYKCWTNRDSSRMHGFKLRTLPLCS